MGWEESRRDQVERWRRASPLERLEWLEQATVAQLKRRGRTSVVRLGWTAHQAAAWLTPDGIVPEAALRESDPAWKGGEICVYRTGPYLTEVTVRGDEVVEIVDILLDAGEAPQIAGTKAPDVAAVFNRGSRVRAVARDPSICTDVPSHHQLFELRSVTPRLIRANPRSPFTEPLCLYGPPVPLSAPSAEEPC